MYCEYTKCFQKREITGLNMKLYVARDVVVPPIPEDPSLMHWCGIIEMAPGFVPCESDPKYIQKYKPNVIIARIQQRNLGTRLKEIQALGNGTNKNAEMRDKFPSPNAMHNFRPNG